MKMRIPSLFPVLLAASLWGFGQQPASRLELLVFEAQQAQAAGNYTAAVDRFAQAVRISPGTAELWANLGLMQHEANQTKAEIASFREAYRLNPSLYVPNLFLGIDYAHAGSTKEAIPFLVHAGRINNKDAQAPLALGRAYIAAGDFTAAAAELERATAIDAKLGAAWFTLGIARLNQVEADANAISNQGKTSSFAGALYAQSLVKQARFGEAVTLYRTLLDTQPQPPCLRAELGFALLRHDPAAAAEQFQAERVAHPECGLALLGQAHIALDNGDAAQFAALLNQLWSRDHGFVIANIGVVLEGLPDAKMETLSAMVNRGGVELAPDLREALANALHPDAAGDASMPTATAQPSSTQPSSTRQSAAQLYAAGEFGECARRLEAMGAAVNVSDLHLLAACAFLTGDYARASAAAAAMEKQQPHSQPHSIEALYWSIQANEKLAFESLARFQQLEPDSHRSHILLGDIYHQLERYKQAESEYQQALAIKPGDSAALLGLASSYLSDNNLDAAGQTARKGLEQAPEDPDLNLVMAEVELGQTQYAAALPYLEKGLHAKAQMQPRVHALMGKAYAELDRTQEAIAELKLGAASDEDGSIQYLLARLYRKSGDARDASVALETLKTIREKRRKRGYKLVEDPELSSSDTALGQAP